MTIPIFKALTAGYTANSILNNIARKFPKYASHIEAARNAGFAANVILKKIAQPNSDASNANEYLTEHERTLQNDKRKKRNAALGLLGTVGTAGALAAGGLSLFNKPQQQQSAPQGNPQIPAGPTLGGQHLNPAPNANAAQPQPQPQVPVQPTAQIAPMPQQGIMNKIPGKTELAYPHLNTFVQNHLKAGKSPDEIYSLLQQSKTYKPIIDKVEKETGLPFSETLKARHGKVSDVSQAQPKIEKGTQVITPDGSIGTIHDKKDTHSLVNVNGKHEQLKNDNIQPVPEEWENIHVDLSKIPEAERSSNLNLVVPWNNNKQLAVRFWDWSDDKPKLYFYERKDGKPIDQKVIESISEETDAPVTGGLEFTGAWDPTGKSRGSAFHHKLKMLSQNANDPEEPDKPYIFHIGEVSFEHGMMTATNEKLKEARRKFNAVHKPSKRKKRRD